MAKESILILDDEKGIVALCDRLLTRAGYQVITASDPNEGLELIRQHELDLMLVDIRMPKLDGFQVIEAARVSQPDMGVVIMTGFGTLETAIRALREGADGLILKPFETGKELVDTIRQALQDRQHKHEVARMQAIRPLLDMTEGLFSETRRQALLDLIINAICGHLRCEHAGIYHRGLGDEHLKLIASQGIMLPVDDNETPDNLIQRVSKTNSPIKVNAEGPGDNKYQDELKELDLGAIISVPISRGDDVMVFYAGRSSSNSVFQAADVDLFGILSQQADVALENARLYGELRAYVSQVEESQRALTQAEKMAAVGRLTASIAHEINNPLQSVLNCLHLTEREELSSEERADYLQLAQDELLRLMQTVRRMLDFYRPGKLEKSSTDLENLIELTLRLLEKQLEQQNIQVEIEFSSKISSVMVVKNQLQQVFFNIILNAMNAMPDGGELSIKATLNSKWIEIEFQDSGMGVLKDKLQEIFEPFFSTSEDGSGLGLSVSYGILTAHGGNLELVPGNGKGACFRISLPIEEK